MPVLASGEVGAKHGASSVIVLRFIIGVFFVVALFYILQCLLSELLTELETYCLGWAGCSVNSQHLSNTPSWDSRPPKPCKAFCVGTVYSNSAPHTNGTSTHTHRALSPAPIFCCCCLFLIQSCPPTQTAFKFMVPPTFPSN